MKKNIYTKPNTVNVKLDSNAIMDLGIRTSPVGSGVEFDAPARVGSLGPGY